MGLYNNLKEVAEVVQKADNIDLYRKILDIQKESLDLLDENRQLKDEVYKLRKKLDIENNVVYLQDAYYVNKHGDFDGPYCRVCWDKEKKLIRMSIGNYIYGEAACMVCNFVAKSIVKGDD